MLAFLRLPAGIFEVKLPLCSLGQQHRDEFGHILIILIHLSRTAAVAQRSGRCLVRNGKAGRTYNSSWRVRLHLDQHLCHSAFHFWVHVLTGVCRVSRCRTGFPWTELSPEIEGFTICDSTTTHRELGFLWSPGDGSQNCLFQSAKCSSVVQLEERLHDASSDVNPITAWRPRTLTKFISFRSHVRARFTNRYQVPVSVPQASVVGMRVMP